MDFDFSDLAATDDEFKATKGSAAQKFPCGQCGGTGRYQGARVHQEKSHCFACRGTGFFKTDPRKLKQRAVARSQKKDADLKAFHDAHADVIREVGKAADWSSFAASLIDQLNGRKLWTENQLAAAERMAAKLVANREAKKAEAKKAEVAVNLNPIRAMFETAVGSGYKKPCYRAEGLKITRAPDFGRNPGALYVVRIEDDAYLGKIEGTTYKPSRGGEVAAEALLAIAADPKAAAIRYGQRTGTCSCCGRQLTKHTSIDAGIGPICASRFGFV